MLKEMLAFSLTQVLLFPILTPLTHVDLGLDLDTSVEGDSIYGIGGEVQTLIIPERSTLHFSTTDYRIFTVKGMSLKVVETDLPSTLGVDFLDYGFKMIYDSSAGVTFLEI